jgi:hypothetical protein
MGVTKEVVYEIASHRRRQDAQQRLRRQPACQPFDMSLDGQRVLEHDHCRLP